MFEGELGALGTMALITIGKTTGLGPGGTMMPCAVVDVAAME